MRGAGEWLSHEPTTRPISSADRTSENGRVPMAYFFTVHQALFRYLRYLDYRLGGLYLLTAPNLSNPLVAGLAHRLEQAHDTRKGKKTRTSSRLFVLFCLCSYTRTILIGMCLG